MTFLLLLPSLKTGCKNIILTNFNRLIRLIAFYLNFSADLSSTVFAGPFSGETETIYVVNSNAEKYKKFAFFHSSALKSEDRKS